MKITFERMKKFESIYNTLYALPKFKDTKLAYAFKRFSEKNLHSVFKEYNSKLEDIRIDNALEDKDTKALLYEADGGYKFSKEGKKNVLKQMREEEIKWNDKEFEVEPFICKEVPGDIKLSIDEVETLEGLILNSKKDK